MDKREALRKFMQENNLTAYSWAKKAGIAEGTIRAFLKGTSNSLNYETVTKLAAAVNVTPDRIFPDNIQAAQASKSLFNTDKTSDPNVILRNMVENHDGKNYEVSEQKLIDRDIFFSAVEMVDNLLEQKNINIPKKRKIMLYFAWHDLMKYAKLSEGGEAELFNTIMSLASLMNSNQN